MKNLLLKFLTPIAIGLLVSNFVYAVTVLFVPQGGTGWDNFQSGTIPIGNGTARFSTTTAATAGQVLMFSNGTWVPYATSSSSSGITSLNGLTGATQTFANNGYLDIISAGTIHTFNSTTSPFF